MELQDYFQLQNEYKSTVRKTLANAISSYAKNNISLYDFRQTVARIEHCDDFFKRIYSGGRYYPEAPSIQKTMCESLCQYVKNNISLYDTNQAVSRAETVAKTETVKKLILTEEEFFTSSMMEPVEKQKKSAKDQYVKNNISNYDYQQSEARCTIAKEAYEKLSKLDVLSKNIKSLQVVDMPEKIFDTIRNYAFVDANSGLAFKKTEKSAKRSILNKIIALIKINLYLYKKSRRPVRVMSSFEKLSIQVAQADMSYKEEVKTLLQAITLLGQADLKADYTHVLENLVAQCIKDQVNQKLGSTPNPLLAETLLMCQNQVKSYVDEKFKKDHQDTLVIQRYLKAKM